MRLINTHTLEIHEFTDARHAPEYAILSHCWGENEVSYKDFVKEQNREGAGYRKIIECCQFARSRLRQWVWIDTCCIDKRSSAELSEAINSMYDWYERAFECYAYVIDVTASPSDHALIDSQLRASRWFRRGWTLQELIAPTTVMFVSSTWCEIGYKPTRHMPFNLRQGQFSDLVADITGIPSCILRYSGSLTDYSAAQRLSWLAFRETARVEDLAYCLLGIFGIHMPLLYGEGHEAFSRLLHAILNKTGDESVLAISYSDLRLFPQTPDSYRQGWRVRRIDFSGRDPITVSTRWAELRSSSSRSSVFYNRNMPRIHLVRLHCAFFEDHLLPSPCIVFLLRDVCGHYTPPLYGDFSPYLSRRETNHPYCERDLDDPNDWIPLPAGKTSLVHLTAQDGAGCWSQLEKEQRSSGVQFLLKDSA